MRDLLTLQLLRLAAWLTTDGSVRIEIVEAIMRAENSLYVMRWRSKPHQPNEEDWG